MLFFLPYFWANVYQFSGTVLGQQYLSSLSTMRFKDSYTNVSNLGGTLCFLRRGGPALCVVFKFKRGTFFKRGPVKDRPPLLFARLLQRASILSPHSWFVPVATPLGRGLSYLHGNSADPSQMHFLFVKGSPWHLRSRITSF